MRWEFDIPPLAEQRRIVSVLSAWDLAIEGTERLVAAKRRRLSGVLSNLVFTRRRAHGQNDVSEIELKALGDLIRGVTYNPDEDTVSGQSPGAVAILTAGNVQAGQLSLSGSETFVSPRCVKSQQTIRKGDFVLSMSNGSKSLVGKAGLVYGEIGRIAAPGAFCAVFRPKDHMARLVASMLFESDSYREQLHIALAGSSINNLTNGELESFRFFVAPNLTSGHPEFFRVVAEDLAKLGSLLTNLRAQKRGLVNKLLAGEWQLGDRFDTARISPAGSTGATA
jgi:type I restriction enzyme S subunit